MTRNDLFLAILVMAIWGFNFSMIKMGITEVHPLLATAARFTLASFLPSFLFDARMWLGATYSVTV